MQSLHILYGIPSKVPLITKVLRLEQLSKHILSKEEIVLGSSIAVIPEFLKAELPIVSSLDDSVIFFKFFVSLNASLYIFFYCIWHYVCFICF